MIADAPVQAPVLEVAGLDAHYGQIQALWSVSLAVGARETVAIIGANGAGKTTLLRTIAGSLTPTGGQIRFDGRARESGAWRVNQAGIALVPEGRRVFPSLSAHDNLRVSFDHRNRQRRAQISFALDDVYSLFPGLQRVRENRAAQLSGGEQQMLAIGRALLSQPDLLLVDELSLGLAPAVVKVLYARLAEIKARGPSIVFVEQDVRQSLRFADRVYVLRHGRVTLQGARADLSYRAVREAYFGS